MLQKPGSSTPRPTRSAKPAAQESPEEVIRKLSRLPSNKKCCDCTSKLPNIVNVTIGAFLCSTCAGIHRELPSTPRIKSIGHTTFTLEEVAFLTEQGGNERVNAVYLAQYEASRERLRPPTDNSDVHLLRTWIHRKYKDKAWYRGTEAPTHTVSSTANTNRQRPSGGTTMTSGRGVAGAMRQPTVVANIPPKAAAVVDFFDTPAAPPTTAAVDEWDAFRTSRTQPAVDDFANFGGNATAVPESPASFANFDAPPVSSAAVPPPVDHFAAFPPNVNAAGMNPPMNTSVQSNASNNFPSHTGGMMMPPANMPSQHPPTNQFAAFPTTDGFAHFENMSSMANSYQVAPPPSSSTEPAPQGGLPNGPHDKFDAFNSLQMPTETATQANGEAPAVVPTHTAGPTNAPGTVASKQSTKTAKYASGQKVYYKSASYVGPAEVVKVHWDDALEPFYTIHVEGKEKQTDDGHLAEDHPMQQEIQSLLARLSVDQLQQVKQYILTLSTANTMHSNPVVAPSMPPQPAMSVHSQVPVVQPTPTAAPAPPSSSQPVQFSMSNQPQGLPMTHGPQQPMQPATNMLQQALTHNMQHLSMNNMPVPGAPTMPQPIPPPTSGATGGMSMQPQAGTAMMMNAGSSTGFGGFGGIPSPGAMDGANATVPNASLPPPPLVQGGPGNMMMHPPQGQFPAPTMAPQGYMMQAPQYPPSGQFPTGSNPPYPTPPGGSSFPPAQSHLPPQNHPAPQSPLSPKGNPFDFY